MVRSRIGAPSSLGSAGASAAAASGRSRRGTGLRRRQRGASARRRPGRASPVEAVTAVADARAGRARLRDLAGRSSPGRGSPSACPGRARRGVDPVAGVESGHRRHSSCAKPTSPPARRARSRYPAPGVRSSCRHRCDPPRRTPRIAVESSACVDRRFGGSSGLPCWAPRSVRPWSPAAIGPEQRAVAGQRLGDRDTEPIADAHAQRRRRSRRRRPSPRRPRRPRPSPPRRRSPAPLTGALVPPSVAAAPPDRGDDRRPRRRPGRSPGCTSPTSCGTPRPRAASRATWPSSRAGSRRAIGPVRSARSYYVAWASEWNAVYAHAGGSPQALATLRAEGRRPAVYDANEFR